MAQARNSGFKHDMPWIAQKINIFARRRLLQEIRLLILTSIVVVCEDGAEISKIHGSSAGKSLQLCRLHGTNLAMARPDPFGSPRARSELKCCLQPLTKSTPAR